MLGISSPEGSCPFFKSPILQFPLIHPHDIVATKVIHEAFGSPNITVLSGTSQPTSLLSGFNNWPWLTYPFSASRRHHDAYHRQKDLLIASLFEIIRYRQMLMTFVPRRKSQARSLRCVVNLNVPTVMKMLIIIGQRSNQLLDYWIAVPTPRSHRVFTAQVEMQFRQGFAIAEKGVDGLDRHTSWDQKRILRPSKNIFR
jgi:hypothetical protein